MYFTPWTTYDVDATAWIRAVEQADGEELELGVRKAMNQYVLDLKSNSIWSTINTMVVKMGARTLAGILVDVKDPTRSWTNYNFVSGDYSRTTGLVGNASTKYLDSGVAASSLSQNSMSAWAYINTLPNANDYLFGRGLVGSSGSVSMYRYKVGQIDANISAGGAVTQSVTMVVGLVGAHRTSSSSVTLYNNGTSYVKASGSVTTNTGNLLDYSCNTSAANFSSHRGQITGFGASVPSFDNLKTVTDSFVTAIAALGL